MLRYGYKIIYVNTDQTYLIKHIKFFNVDSLILYQIFKSYKKLLALSNISTSFVQEALLRQK
jgi:hypothetical protein